MRLTKEDGKILLGAIRAELDSQHWRELARSKYNPQMPDEIEQHVKSTDQIRAEALRRVRDKIKAQI
jgi:hypothetical protein